MNTLGLTLDTWDLTVDGDGNIAVFTDQTAIAQDVASGARTFQGEVWFELAIGIPYLTDVLGQAPSTALLQEAYNAMALMVPDVVQAQTILEPFGSSRLLTGTIQVIDTTGQSLNTTF